MTFRIATKEESAEFWKNRPKSLGDGPDPLDSSIGQAESLQGEFERNQIAWVGKEDSVKSTGPASAGQCSLPLASSLYLREIYGSCLALLCTVLQTLQRALQ